MYTHVGNFIHTYIHTSLPPTLPRAISVPNLVKVKRVTPVRGRTHSDTQSINVHASPANDAATCSNCEERKVQWKCASCNKNYCEQVHYYIPLSSLPTYIYLF